MGIELNPVTLDQTSEIQNDGMSKAGTKPDFGHINRSQDASMVTYIFINDNTPWM